MERSPILKEMIESGAIGIVGGTHEISSGMVQFYEDTMIINEPVGNILNLIESYNNLPEEY